MLTFTDYALVFSIMPFKCVVPNRIATATTRSRYMKAMECSRCFNFLARKALICTDGGSVLSTAQTGYHQRILIFVSNISRKSSSNGVRSEFVFWRRWTLFPLFIRRNQKKGRHTRPCDIIMIIIIIIIMNSLTTAPIGITKWCPCARLCVKTLFNHV